MEYEIKFVANGVEIYPDSMGVEVVAKVSAEDARAVVEALAKDMHAEAKAVAVNSARLLEQANADRRAAKAHPSFVRDLAEIEATLSLLVYNQDKGVSEVAIRLARLVSLLIDDLNQP